MQLIKGLACYVERCRNISFSFSFSSAKHKKLFTIVGLMSRVLWSKLSFLFSFVADENFVNKDEKRAEKEMR